MRPGISFTVSPVDRARLEAVVADRNSSQKHIWRCRIVLLTADGQGTNAIMREAGVAKTAVWRWQERFVAYGVMSACGTSSSTGTDESARNRPLQAASRSGPGEPLFVALTRDLQPDGSLQAQ
jgi:Homeodomain-like domain-containing protein